MTGSVTLGQVIWSSVKPIIKIYLIIGTGFFLAKRNILTVETARNVSDIILTVFLPSLTFNKVVTNIQGSDIKDIGVILWTSLIIFGLGGLFSVLVRFTTPVPRRFFGGLLACGIFPNISDLPIAYLQTMDTGLVFTESQGEKGIAHVIIFLTAFNLCLFNFGGFRLIERDFINERKEQEDIELQNTKEGDAIVDDDEDETMTQEQLRRSASNTIDDTLDIDLTEGRSNSRGDTLNSDDDENSLDEASMPVLLTRDTQTPPPSEQEEPQHHNIRRRRSSAASRRRNTLVLTNSRRSDISTSSSFLRANLRVNELRRLPSQNIQDVVNEYSEATGGPAVASDMKLNKIMTTDVGMNSEDIKNSGATSDFIKKYHLELVVFFLQNCLRPCSMSTLIGLVIAFIPWTKALFVHTDTYMPDAPDDLPPLNFIMDYTSYVGAASVPFALILLGGSIARIKITSLPKGFWKSAVLMVVLRLCILPILGVLWVRALVAMGGIDKDDDMMRFVCIISFGLPTMTSVIYFTASYTLPESKDKVQMNCSSLLLLMQYPVLVISLPFLATYTIKVELGY